MDKFAIISRNTPSGAPDHIVSDVLPKLIRGFGSFNIILLQKGDPASVDQPTACGQEPTSSKTNHQRKKEKKIHEGLFKVAPAEHPIKCVSGQFSPIKSDCPEMHLDAQNRLKGKLAFWLHEIFYEWGQKFLHLRASEKNLKRHKSKLAFSRNKPNKIRISGLIGMDIIERIGNF